MIATAPIHLVTGNTGAGKSTYAARLAASEQAHVIAVDEWMRVLFHPDQPDPPSYDWAIERTRRIDRQAVTEATRLAALGVPIILDLGFFAREHRERVRAAVAAAGGTSVLHVLDVPKDERWHRVERRNRDRPAGWQFDVDRATFDLCEGLYEPPGADELAGAVMVDVSPQP